MHCSTLPNSFVLRFVSFTKKSTHVQVIVPRSTN
jgi:hypothetical protein